jgi:hypothetical protein
MHPSTATPGYTAVRLDIYPLAAIPGLVDISFAAIPGSVDIAFAPITVRLETSCTARLGMSPCSYSCCSRYILESHYSQATYIHT